MDDRMGEESGCELNTVCINDIQLEYYLILLCSEDVALRWHGNRMPEQDTEHGTIGEFYLAHRQAQNAEVYFGRPPVKYKNYKNRFMCLEILVDKDSVCVFYL